jgi:hypothetical protein
MAMLDDNKDNLYENPDHNPDEKLDDNPNSKPDNKLKDSKLFDCISNENQMTPSGDN